MFFCTETPGLGKTTLASIVANEMGVELRTTSGLRLKGLVIWLLY